MLDVGDAAVPMPALVRIGGPLSKLLRDVGGRRYAGGSDRKLAPLGEDPIRDGQLAPCGTRGDGQLASLDPEPLTPITLHECRHTFASLLIDSGANPKAIQTFMGHSKIQTTFDIYGHLLPGSHDEVRERMDAYLTDF